jgi:uncharacterized membrane protein YkvA (DUF1232 family)
MLLIVSALIYLVMPLDLIPDFVPLLGFTDDATVILFVLKQINSDLALYKEWKAKIEVESKI